MRTFVLLDRVETVVIGAGCVGLACARSIAKMGKEVLILERETSIGTGISSRNSEVIHAGLYYPKNSLKAELCVKGRELLYQYCHNRGIPHRKIGKLIVASESKDKATHESFSLEKLKSFGVNNGVTGLKLLSQHDVQFMEPDIRVASSDKAALYSPETGIVNSHELMVSLLAEAEEHGAQIAYGSPVDNVYLSDSSKINHKGGNPNETINIKSQGMELECDVLINAAGLFSHRIAKQLFESIDKTDIIPSRSHSLRHCQQFFAKGNYYRLEGQKNPFHHLIYPIPDQPGGLGVHATIDLGGSCRFGPDVEWLDPTIECDEIDYTPNPDPESFYEEVRKYWPDLKDGSLAPDYCGIRPKINHPDLVQNDNHPKFFDFVIEGEKQHGVKGFINMMGIESPGLTSCLAIGEKVALMIK